ncbi:hypothetical protein JTB14_017901 [Gonioctena quinquepunctata]|nr:hypothetical protein JTB14_017901 [Gonioctena quinquepunctata]
MLTPTGDMDFLGKIPGKKSPMNKKFLRYQTSLLVKPKDPKGYLHRSSIDDPHDGGDINISRKLAIAEVCQRTNPTIRFDCQ